MRTGVTVLSTWLALRMMGLEEEEGVGSSSYSGPDFLVTRLPCFAVYNVCFFAQICEGNDALYSWVVLIP